MSLRWYFVFWMAISGVWASLQAQSQADFPVSAQAQNKPMADILRQLEQTHPIRFYYRVADLPERTFSVSWEGVRLDDALKQLLAGGTLGYFYYRSYGVVLAPYSVIDAGYSADYYRALSQNLQGISQDDPGTAANSWQVGDIGRLNPSGRAQVDGVLLDEQTSEPIIGATLEWTDLKMGASTDEQGKFSLRLPTGKHQLKVQYIGYESILAEVQIYGDGELNLRMRSAATELDAVIVSAAAADDNVGGVRIGVERLDMKNIEKLPTLLGETDVVRGLLLNPGVTTIGEGAAGFNVRGGAVDQNLILQDDALIINSSHALGFFSTLNSDLISSVDLYKGSIPAQYGGRLASVLDVQMRDGNFERYKVKASIGPVSSRLSLEGPVFKGKSSFIIGGRASYANWILKRVKVEEVRRSSASFYDLNFRYTHRFNEKNTLILTAYTAADQFLYNQQFGFDYQTQTGQLIYKRIFNERLFSRLTLSLSDYNSTQQNLESSLAGRVDNGLTYLSAKEQVTFIPNRNLRLDAGLSAMRYWVSPGDQQPLSTSSLVLSKTLPQEHGLESAVFANAEWTLSARLSLVGGLRFNWYQYLGPRDLRLYAPGLPYSTAHVIDTASYAKGERIASYQNLEPRLSARYRLGPGSSIKVGYSRTSQYINQIFNSATPTPTSQYQLSTPYIPPFKSHNVSAGYFLNLKDNVWETSAEVYYRKIDQLWDYKDFAQLLVNSHLETEISTGNGRAYGLELSLKTNRAILNGQLSYTFSRTEQRVPGISLGEWYPNNFNQPHSISLLLNYSPNQRNTISANFVYGSGRPTTAPLTNYRYVNGIVIPIYSARNQLNIPDYHRLDLSYTLGKGYNKTKTIKTSWNLSLYNVYFRKNAFSVFFTQRSNQNTIANRLAILGSVFPAITINIETI